MTSIGLDAFGYCYKLKEIMVKEMDIPRPPLKWPMVMLIVGVNGVGKTTTIGKLALRFQQIGRKVMLAAGDTFRAAAAEQLTVWAQRARVPIVKHEEGADPAAVVYDAIQSAKANEADLLLVDTAGRLHNKKNLMDELNKMRRVIDRDFPEADVRCILVLDATTGQNGLAQAKAFKEVCEVGGIILTKLDGTAKGGIALAIRQELDVPRNWMCRSGILASAKESMICSPLMPESLLTRFLVKAVKMPEK